MIFVYRRQDVVCNDLQEIRIKLGIAEIYKIQFGKLRANTVFARDKNDSFRLIKGKY